MKLWYLGYRDLMSRSALCNLKLAHMSGAILLVLSKLLTGIHSFNVLNLLLDPSAFTGKQAHKGSNEE